MSDFWPTELRVSKDRQRLVVTFNDGASFDLSAEMLRVLSPSAEVKGHGPGQEVTVPGKRNVAIISMTPTGNYAVRIGFDDFHDTGIYTWSYLRELGEKRRRPLRGLRARACGEGHEPRYFGKSRDNAGHPFRKRRGPWRRKRTQTI